jgi:enoyl-CoA hydratase/carnithine racemase
MEMILTGEIIDANTAFSIGLVNHVVPAAQLETKAMEIANRIADKSPIALQLGEGSREACVAVESRRRSAARSGSVCALLLNRGQGRRRQRVSREA